MKPLCVILRSALKKKLTYRLVVILFVCSPCKNARAFLFVNFNYIYKHEIITVVNRFVYSIGCCFISVILSHYNENSNTLNYGIFQLRLVWQATISCNERYRRKLVLYHVQQSWQSTSILIGRSKTTDGIEITSMHDYFYIAG